MDPSPHASEACASGPAAPSQEERLLLLERSGLLEPRSEPGLDRWIRKLAGDLGASIGGCALSGADRTVLKSSWTEDGAPSEPLELEPGATLERWLRSRTSASHSDPKPDSYIEAPITVDGQHLGLVGAVVPAAPARSGGAVSATKSVAAAISTEVALRLSGAENSRVRELVAAHNSVHELIARQAPLGDVLGAIVSSIERHDPSVLPSVVLLDPETSTLHPGARVSLPAEFLNAIDGVVIGPNVGSCGAAAWSGRLTVTEDIAEDPRWTPIREFALGFGLRHCWSTPIKAPGGVVLGTLAFYGRRPRLPSADHEKLLTDWARVAGIAIERHHALERLTRDARFDELTGLPNRTAIFELLERAIQRTQPSSPIAVMFIDLDGLKGLNDTLGHDRADELLREIGQRLAATVRETDFVGRMGGDEFIVIVEDLADVETVGQLAERLLGCISVPLPGAESATVTASIGITLLTSPSIDGREAIRQADSAMYDAKRSGRDRCVFYEGRQPVRVGRRLLLAQQLRDVERRGELALDFQPVIRVPTGAIVGVEALLRWDSPRFARVSPAEFIPIAQDTGTIVPIGAWALRESCETIARVPGELELPLELAVNVSARQVANPKFSRWVEQTIAHSGLRSELLTLELAETALARPDATTERTLRELHELGVRIVLDDFGSGSSSLLWLREYPLQALKIGRGFIAGIAKSERDRAIVASVISMGRRLGLTVTAVGVESEAQLAVLHELDCPRAQGFLIARPGPAEDLHTLLTRWQPLTPATGATERLGVTG